MRRASTGARELVSRYADGKVERTDWAGIARDSRRLARALERLGMKRGDRVGTLAMNHGRHVAAWYGTIGMGGVIHTINPRLFDDQLVYIANHAEDRVLFYDAAFAPIVERLRARWTSIEHFICFDSPQFEALIAAESDDYVWVEGDEREPAMLCYTSGTTGNPKGVLYEHRSTVLHAMVQLSPDVFDLSARAVVLPVVPMFHAAGWALPFCTAMAGGKMVLSADYTPQVMCDLMKAEGVTHTAGVPTVWLALLNHVDSTGADLGKLTTVHIGGSAAPRAMIEWFMDRGIRVGHAWGMTEMSPLGTVGAGGGDWDELSREERVALLCKQGRVPFGVELRTVDDDGNLLPRDGKTSGRLQAAGPWDHPAIFPGLERGRASTRRVVRHRRRRRAPPRRSAPDHRPVEGRDQVRAASGSARSISRTPPSAAPESPRRRRWGSGTRSGTSGRSCWW
jgi:fatty-acyl-CoA synthase